MKRTNICALFIMEERKNLIVAREDHQSLTREWRNHPTSFPMHHTLLNALGSSHTPVSRVAVGRAGSGRAHGLGGLCDWGWGTHFTASLQLSRLVGPATKLTHPYSQEEVCATRTRIPRKQELLLTYTALGACVQITVGSKKGIRTFHEKLWKCLDIWRCLLIFLMVWHAVFLICILHINPKYSFLIAVYFVLISP